MKFRPHHPQHIAAAKAGFSEQTAEWARCVWQLLTDQGQKIVKDGKTLETPEENLAELTAQANALWRTSFRYCGALEIV